MTGTSNDRNAFSRPTSNASRMWSQSSLDFESDEGDTRALMKAIAESLTELETPVGKLPTADWENRTDFSFGIEKSG